MVLTSPCFLCDGWDFSGEATPKLPHEISLELHQYTPVETQAHLHKHLKEGVGQCAAFLQLMAGLNEETDSGLSSPFCMHQTLGRRFDLCHSEVHRPYIKGGAGQRLQKVAKGLCLEWRGRICGVSRQGVRTAPEQDCPPSSTGCRASVLFKGMVSDRRGCHLAKQKLPRFSPTIILSLSIQVFETTLHRHWRRRTEGRRDTGKSNHQPLEEARSINAQRRTCQEPN